MPFVSLSLAHAPQCVAGVMSGQTKVIRCVDGIYSRLAEPLLLMQFQQPPFPPSVLLGLATFRYFSLQLRLLHNLYDRPYVSVSSLFFDGNVFSLFSSCHSLPYIPALVADRRPLDKLIPIMSLYPASATLMEGTRWFEDTLLRMRVL